MQVSRLRAHELDAIREVRLRALRDAPYAFSSSAGEEEARGEEWWRHLTSQSEAGEEGATFLARRDGRVVGMAGAFLLPERPGWAQVWGMWVAPEARGSGAGRSLMRAVIDWARSRGVAALRLGLSTSPSSAPAEALYTSLGFELTGEQEPMESDPSLGARIMTLRLG